ncbi:hypothetical protein D3C87_103960 [compost metagenome]
MILMWLGSFVLVLWGMTESRKYASLLLGEFQKKFYQTGFEAALPKMLRRVASVVALEVSPQRSLYTGMALYNMRIVSQRSAVLMMCLSTLGVWWILSLGLLFLNYNGLMFLGVGVLLFVGALNLPRFQNLLKWIAMTGLFLLGGEMMLRQASVLPMMMGDGELAFFLADGRFVAVGTLFILAVVVSFIVEEEFWSFPLALSLMVANTISFNGALGIFAGERIGRLLLFWWRTRSLNQDCRRIGWQFSLSSAAGVLFGLFIAGEARSTLGAGSMGMGSMQDKLSLLVTLLGVILLFQFLAQMVWGHFGAQVKVDELQEVKYFGRLWGQRQLLSLEGMTWAKSKVHQRLNEIKYHLQGLETVKSGQIPEVIQTRLKTEEEQLSKLEHEVLKSLS